MKGGEREMPHEPKTIHIDEASELARLLSEADNAPLRLTAGSASYRVIREEPRTHTDAAGFNATLDKLTGAWADLDTDKMIEDLYRAREEGSRPATRP
jgi:hypothetical protein